MSSKDKITFRVDQKELERAMSTIRNKRDSVDGKWMKSTHRRNLKPVQSAMRQNSKSQRIRKMIGITTAKRRTGELGALVGVVKNDAALFPKFSAPATASVIEYGTDERFKGVNTGVFVTGATSTGRMPADPFLRPAWDMNVNNYAKKTEQDIIKRIETAGARV